MAALTKDPLLAAARIVLTVVLFILMFAMVMLGIGLGACLTFASGDLSSELADAGAPGSAYWMVIAVMALAEVLLFLGVRFVRELGGIVRSVDAGDPFAPENADRLSRMGWITVIAYAPSLLIGALAAWLEASVKTNGDHFDFDVNLGGGGIVLILTLFVLARVFRQGTAMREDLEGTV